MNYVCSTAVVILALVVGGCSQFSDQNRLSDAQVNAVLAGDAFQSLGHPRLQDFSDELEKDPFALTEEMKDFIEHFVPAEAGISYKISWLRRALIGTSGLSLEYRPDVTLSTEEAFLMREVNCLSFTMLYAAFAEHLGIKFNFNEVDVPPVWDERNNNSWVFYKHVNIIAKDVFQNRFIVDVNAENYETYYPQRYVGKDYISALYYTNVGVEMMLDERYPEAFLSYKKALEMEPKLSAAWSNLGVLYKRMGELDIAVAAFKQAVIYGGSNMVAVSNLARTLEQTGRIEEAKLYQKKASKLRDSNPYYHYNFALSKFNKGDIVGAEASLNRAIVLYEKEHRFYLMQAKIAARHGDREKAKRALESARQLAEKSADRNRYSAKLAQLK